LILVELFLIHLACGTIPDTLGSELITTFLGTDNFFRENVNGIAIVDSETGCLTYTANNVPITTDTVVVTICDFAIAVCYRVTYIVNIDGEMIVDTSEENILFQNVSIPLDATEEYCPLVPDSFGDNLSVEGLDGSLEGTSELGSYQINTMSGCIQYQSNGLGGLDTIGLIICDLMTDH